MATLFVKRVGETLVPADEASVQALSAIPRDKLLRCEVTQSRNIRHHRLFFALCARIAGGIGESTEFVERAFKVETGHYTTFRTGKKEVLVLESIAFAKMDEIAFTEFFERCVAVAYSRWGIDPKDVADLLTPEEVQKTK